MAYCKNWQKADAMSHNSTDYEEVMHAAGYRVTPQRVLILDAVCAAEGHTSLGDVYARARAADRSIDRSTVYRALKLFVELGLVVSADVGDGETYYEIAKPKRHHHLVCRRCGKEQEVEDVVMESLFQQVLDVYGFEADSDHLVLFGMCADCRATNGV